MQKSIDMPTIVMLTVFAFNITCSSMLGGVVIVLSVAIMVS